MELQNLVERMENMTLIIREREKQTRWLNKGREGKILVTPKGLFLPSVFTQIVSLEKIQQGCSGELSEETQLGTV